MLRSYKKKRSYLCTPWKTDTQYCTIPERLQLMAERNQEKEAIVFVEEKRRVGVTYKEIVDGASVMARKMMTIGIQQNDVVAIHDDKSFAWLCQTFGAQMCGAWPLHFCFGRTDGSDVAKVLKQSGCKVVITQPGDDEEYINIMKNFIHFNDDGTITSEDVPSLNKIMFSRKPASLNQALTFDDILPMVENELPEIEPENIAAIFCSSGTTGPPKLISWSHYNLISATLSMFEASDIGFGESLFCDKTFGWIGGYPRGIIIGVTRVTNFKTFKEKSIREICDTTVKIINNENCRHAVLFSTTIDEIMNGNYNMTPLGTIIATGGPASSKGSQIVGRFCKKFINAYAATEVGVISLNVVTSEHDMKSYDTGKPIQGVEVKVVDTKGRLSEVGAVGEIYVRNRSSSTGYLHEEQDWHKINRVEGYWFKTGDSGYISENDHLFVAGRISESIIIEGNILSPSHFEDILIKHPSVEKAVAFGISDEVLYEKVGVAITLTEGKSVSSDELIMFYKTERSLNFDDSFFASKTVPKHILYFDSFPVTSSGKIARRLVKELALDRIGLENRKDQNLNFA